MNIVEKIKNLGWGFFGLIIFGGMLLLASLFIKGGLWLSGILYPWLVAISIITFIICFIVLFPLAIFKKTKGLSAVGFLIASYIFGATLWVWSFLLAYIFWGFFGLFIGLFMGGIGVVPIAIIASVFKGEWGIFGQLILVIAITFATKYIAAYLIEDAGHNKLG